VFQSTGIPLSTWIAKAKTTPPLLSYPNQIININNNINHITYRCLHLSLEPEKMILWQRIEHRFDTMLAQGFLGEVASLMQRGDLSLEMPSMRCVGYRQAWKYLNNTTTTTTINNKDYQVFREKGIIATRQLAKRQMTWLRSMPHRVVLNT
jgi:tRNA dimethylallyltransferase